jgi:hypothetical protein
VTKASAAAGMASAAIRNRFTLAFPHSPGDTRFFYRAVDARLTFELGADGTASAVVLHQNGRDR